MSKHSVCLKFCMSQPFFRLILLSVSSFCLSHPSVCLILLSVSSFCLSHHSVCLIILSVSSFCPSHPSVRLIILSVSSFCLSHHSVRLNILSINHHKLLFSLSHYHHINHHCGKKMKRIRIDNDYVYPMLRIRIDCIRIRILKI